MPAGQLTSRVLVAEVKHMLSLGFRHKYIAERCKISKRLVERISAGAITGKPRASAANAPKLERVRCTGCRRLVFELPCLACKAEQQLERALANQRKAIGR